MFTRKRVLSILLTAILLLAAVPVMTYASNPSAEAEAYDPPPPTRYSNINSITVTLSISSGTATCKSTIIGYSGTTKIVGTYTLQRKPAGGSYSDYNPWPAKTVNGSVLSFSETCSVTTGYTYRLKCVASVTTNGTVETVTVYSAENAY